jgi:hypothetical protein
VLGAAAFGKLLPSARALHALHHAALETTHAPSSVTP